MDGQTDTQKFGGYNIIPRHFLWRGIKKNCDLDINHRPLKQEPIKDMFILSKGMATSLISLCFSIIGIRSRSQLLLEENFFHCSGLLIFRLNLT